MIVKINGADSPVRGDGLPKMADLIELIKSSIDPDHMITSILLNGKDLDDNDWVAGLSQYGTAIIEVETGTPSDFVSDRMSKASTVIESCFFDFRNTRKAFQEGDMQSGNKNMLKAVNTMQAFFEWYGTLTELVPTEDRNKFDLSDRVREISAVLKRLCQLQLYQSWWALGEAIEKDLEPKLDNLETFCRQFSKRT